MTIEQKAKAYDEAKYIMKEYLESGNAGVIAENTIKKAFPELRESEDERIRKWLIKDMGRRLSCWTSTEVTKEQVLAWLEKQGAKVSAIEGFESEFERQVSYLIASTINKENEYNEGYVKWTANALLNYARYELEKQGEQKPAWSEKDQEIWEEISVLLWEGFKKTHTKFSWNEIKDWIKPKIESLKVRAQSQSQWKPSDEQMGVIEAVINNRSFQRRHLDSLYEQLKKLKGE